MKFLTRKDALDYLHSMTPALQTRHCIVKTRYWSMALGQYVSCWTLQLKQYGGM
jgi:hypothetical protein